MQTRKQSMSVKVQELAEEYESLVRSVKDLEMRVCDKVDLRQQFQLIVSNYVYKINDKVELFSSILSDILRRQNVQDARVREIEQKIDQVKAAIASPIVSKNNRLTQTLIGSCLVGAISIAGFNSYLQNL